MAELDADAGRLRLEIARDVQDPDAAGAEPRRDVRCEGDPRLDAQARLPDPAAGLERRIRPPAGRRAEPQGAVAVADVPPCGRRRAGVEQLAKARPLGCTCSRWVRGQSATRYFELMKNKPGGTIK